ncbi:MAG: cupin domain-containing protein [Lentisphaerae bacterium]|jgi:mannose-6-phosphate isomerase-like protein (cupin superfamily)|nr:cupin domain-containing protein [Lentisphaerota bacterium]MBT4818745.1 cupin domain-containing protein [Lentisphaerota bacterium]MBT5605908.1 cupin domain-containing protein [Lentisphaerota bacterium]MBT7057987.1 cupin domain-containing protein [Lentisphaerota bacterium]MBT7848542.1 cupin domain-containing protein [Lentisphaerota bacterium]
MDELRTALDISMSGDEASAAVSAARAQIDTWGLVMPETDPLPFDFGLGRFPEIGEVEFWIANEVEAGYCGKFLFVQDGQTCPLHEHHEKHETFFMVKGTVSMQYGGAERVMTEGDVLPVAPGELHSFTGMGPALLLEVSKTCLVDDNYFADPDIPIGGNYRG